MSRSMIQAVLFTSLCPLLMAQHTSQVALTLNPSQSAPAAQQAADVPQPSAGSQRALALKNARTISICAETAFLSAGTLDRALLMQKDWEKLGLNIVNNPSRADLMIQVNRVVFTHIHTYVLTDKATGIVLAAGRARALDGVLASGPMAEQIVKILAEARLPARTEGSGRGL